MPRRLSYALESSSAIVDSGKASEEFLALHFLVYKLSELIGEGTVSLLIVTSEAEWQQKGGAHMARTG